MPGGQRAGDGLLQRDNRDALQRQLPRRHDRTPLRLPDEAAADDQPLDLAGALVQAQQADVAVDALDGTSRM